MFRTRSASRRPQALVNVTLYHPFGVQAMTNGEETGLGGAQLRAAILARSLARLPSFHVQLLVQDHGYLDLKQSIDDVQISVNSLLRKHLADYARREYRQSTELRNSFPWVKIKEFRWGLAWQIPLLVGNRLLSKWSRNRPKNPCAAMIHPFLLRHTDVLCVFRSGENVRRMVSWCRKNGRKTVFFVTGDSQLCCRDLLTHREVIDYSPEEARHLEFLLTNVDQVVAQTMDQVSALKELFGRQAFLIKNPLPVDGLIRPSNKGRIVLWIGRADLVHKRSDRLLELARRCPDLPFVAIINRWQENVFEEMQRLAPTNLTIIEKTSHREVLQLMEESALLVNTSASEGFPNSFLQAAIREVPVVSLRVDPDGFCSRHCCGVACGDDIARMAAVVTRLWFDPAERKRIGMLASEYVTREHNADEKGQQLAAMLVELCSS